MHSSSSAYIIPALLWLANVGYGQTPAGANNIVFRNGSVQRQSFSWPGQGGAGDGLVMTATASSTRWVTVQFRTMAEPPLPEPGSFGGGVLRDQNTVHRLLFDKNSQTYVGYDLVLSSDASYGYRVAFQELSNSPAMLSRFASGLALKPMPPAKYPTPQLVRQGENIALDVMITPDGRQKIVDYLQFSPPEPVDLPAASTPADPRDFTVDDEPLSINLDSLERTTVFIDGQRFTGRVGFAGRKGGALWIVFPGPGRYVISLASHPGFAKAGSVRDHVIAFHDGDHQFEIRLARSVVGPGHAWNLYVHHDTAYSPTPAWADALVIGTGRLEDILAGH